MKQSEACIFVPSPTPRKLGNKRSHPDWDDVGSVAIFSAEGGWKDGVQSKGLVSLVQRWVLNDGDQGLMCNPEKPGIYLTGPIQVQANHLVRLT